MTERTYAAWVEPIARTLAEDNRELVEFARNAPRQLWDRASDVEGWTYRDILAHTGGGNDQLLQIVLRAVISRKPLGPETFDIDTDAANARGVEARRAWTIERVIDEIVEGEDETQDLLSQLTEDARDRRGLGSPMTLGEFLRIVHKERHDHLHLQQLRAGLSTGTRD